MHFAVAQGRRVTISFCRLYKAAPGAAFLSWKSVPTRQKGIGKGHRHSSVYPKDMLLTGFAHSSTGQASSRIDASCGKYEGSVRRHGRCPEWWSTLEISTGVQESRKTDTKIDINVFASHSEADRDEVALLSEARSSRKQTWWQKLSQSLNMAGVWLFLRVLFVSPSSPVQTIHTHCSISCCMSE